MGYLGGSAFARGAATCYYIAAIVRNVAFNIIGTLPPPSTRVCVTSPARDLEAPALCHEFHVHELRRTLVFVFVLVLCPLSLQSNCIRGGVFVFPPGSAGPMPPHFSSWQAGAPPVPWRTRFYGSVSGEGFVCSTRPIFAVPVRCACI